MALFILGPRKESSTSPIGFFRVFPVGPAIPLTAIDQSDLKIFFIPYAIDFATGAETAPCLFIRLRGTLRTLFLIELL